MNWLVLANWTLACFHLVALYGGANMLSLVGFGISMICCIWSWGRL